MNVAVLLFEDFETLDVFGPVEIFGRLKDHYKVSFFSESGGTVLPCEQVRRFGAFYSPNFVNRPRSFPCCLVGRAPRL